MAKQPTIIHPGEITGVDRVRMLVATATVLEAGDLLYGSKGKAYAITKATHDILFAGIAGESSLATESNDITVYIKCIIDIDVTAASYYVGAELRYTSDNALVAAGSQALAWAHENIVGSTAARIKVLVDVPLLAKKYEMNA